jgi:hypothetical protein
MGRLNWTALRNCHPYGRMPFINDPYCYCYPGGNTISIQLFQSLTVRQITSVVRCNRSRWIPGFKGIQNLRESPTQYDSWSPCWRQKIHFQNIFPVKQETVMNFRSLPVGSKHDGILCSQWKCKSRNSFPKHHKWDYIDCINNPGLMSV